MVFNRKYVETKYGKDLPKENVQRLLKTLNQYGENNKWWESDDPLEVAMYQIFEPCLLVNFSLFHEGLEALLERPVWTPELGLNVEGLRTEAKRAITKLRGGKSEILTDKERAKYIQNSIQMLSDYCQRTGKQIIGINLTEKPEKV